MGFYLFFSNFTTFVIFRRLSSTGSRPLPPLDQTAAENAALEQAQIKQGWSLLAALHCVLLPELVNKSSYCPPRIELLARRSANVFCSVNCGALVAVWEKGGRRSRGWLYGVCIIA